jgi:arylsulfatase A-like enzyme
MRPLFVLAAASAVVVAAASAVVDAAAAAPLKAVVIHLIDDLGFHDLGYTGSLIKTPNLDTLRSEGLLLSNYFVTPICTPSRGALMTSRYPLALGLQGGMTIQQMQTWGLNLNETTLADVLSTSSSVQAHAVGKVRRAAHVSLPPHRGIYL